MPNQNPWDLLAPNATRKEQEPTEWYDADNAYLAEPVILEYLASQVVDTKKKSVLDFGCGDGRFAYRLKELGYDVEGIDSAPKMIEAAKAKYGTALKLQIGGLESLPSQPIYDVIVSVMVLQFIPDFSEVIRLLALALGEGGHLVLVVFNPEFIRDWLKIADSHYVEFDSIDNPTKGVLLFGEVEVPTFLRTAAQYTEVAAENGLSLTLEDYPPFSQEFLTGFPVNGPVKHAEHMILGYKK